MKKCIQGTAGGFDFQLDKGINLEEITVSAPLLSENRYGMNLTEIPVSELRGLPALGGEADLIRTYQLLPGVQGGTEGKAGMFVRGGSGDQNLVLIDGSPLYYINHLGGFISLFDPEAVKNFRLYIGGFPARYGNTLPHKRIAASFVTKDLSHRRIDIRKSLLTRTGTERQRNLFCLTQKGLGGFTHAPGILPRF